MSDRPLDIDDAAFMSRPVRASREDTLVRENEDGSATYMDFSGREYTVSPTAPVSRPEGGVARAVGRGIADTARAAGEAVRGAGGIAQTLYRDIPQALPGLGRRAAEAVGEFASEPRGAARIASGDTATMGDVLDTAGAAVVGSTPFRVPEGSLRLFGGRSAKDFGKDASGRELPKTVGGDRLERFEIDDSQAYFFPQSAPIQNVPETNVDWGTINTAPLIDILDHPELYRQYPEVKDVRVLVDSSLKGNNNGYFIDSGEGIVAVSPAVARNPERFADILIHEVQHKLQKIEGFDSGTRPDSPEVSARVAPRLRDAELSRAVATETFEKFDFSKQFREMKRISKKVSREVQEDGVLDFDDIKFSTLKKDKTVEKDFEQLLNSLNKKPKNAEEAYEKAIDFYSFARDNPQFIDPTDIERFDRTFGVDLNALSFIDDQNFLRELELSRAVPIAPFRYDQVVDDIRYSGYFTKYGEGESRAAEARRKLSIDQRAARDPQLDMGVDPSSQWRVDQSGEIQDVTSFNRGGAVAMDRQNRIPMEGGLTSDGMNVDPISGNEVPAGSLAQEVRDDVPAMLSEGEYIVPADVVRYYGVKFLEDLRQEAKMGLANMESNGRIGGEPVGAPMAGPEGELSPEEMQMLSELSGMAQGGMVSPDQRMAAYNMANYAATIPNQTMGFNQGGVVPQMTQQDFMNQAQQAQGFQLPGSIFAPIQPAQTTASQPVTLYGPQGDVIVVMLPQDQDQYNQLVAQGYTTEAPQQTAPTQDPTEGGDGGIQAPEVTTGDGFSMSMDDLNAMDSDPVGFGMDALSGSGLSSSQMSGIGGLIGGVPGMVAGGIVGTAAAINGIAQAQAAAAVAQAQGLTDTPEYTALQSEIDKAVKSLSPVGKFLHNTLNLGKSYTEQATTGWTGTGPRVEDYTRGEGASTYSDPGTSSRVDVPGFTGPEGRVGGGAPRGRPEGLTGPTGGGSSAEGTGNGGASGTGGGFGGSEADSVASGDLYNKGGYVKRRRKRVAKKK